MFRYISTAVFIACLACAQTPKRTTGTDQQIAGYEAALRAQPQNVHSQLSLALAYLQKVREIADYSYLDRASSLVNKALGDDSSNNQALRLRNEIGLQKHEFREVAQSAQDLTKLVPYDAGNWANLGDALMELGEYKRAGEAYARMLAIRPELESYNRLAYHKFVTGDPEAAIRLMTMAIAAGGRAPENVAWCYAELGDMYFKTGKLQDAIDAYLKAVKLFPALHRAHAGLGRVEAVRGKTQAAIESYKRAAAAVPMVEYFAALEKLYTRMGDGAEARKQRGMIDVLDKLASARGETANRMLALIYIDEGRNLDRAVRLTEGELENRGDVYTFDALAWVYHKQNRMDEARKMADLALKMNTPEPIFYYHAGMIAAGAGKRDEARRLLERALELNPHFDADDADAAAKMLSSLGAHGPI